MSEDSILRLEHICKTFGDREILHDVNLSVKRGETISIIGASGSGKSTLLRCINQLVSPTSGNIIFCSEKIDSDPVVLSKFRSKVCMVFQFFNLFNNLSVLENCVIGQVSVLKRNRKEAEEIAKKNLAKVGMLSAVKKNPRQLSGGQKQRIAIARALSMDPEIILFDEPTSALDPEKTGEVQATIRMLSRIGVTMLIVTHEMNFARQIADRVLFIADGGIYEEGTPEEIFEHPKKEKTIAFIQNLKRVTYKIDRSNFDLMELHGHIQEFSLKYGLSQNECYRLQICTEEMIAILLNSCNGSQNDISVNLEFMERNRVCGITFVSAGEYFDPMEKYESLGKEDLIDNLGLFIIRHKASQYKHSYENGINTITLRM